MSEKRIAVITGASSGIGLEFLRLMLQRPEVEEVWAIARNAQKLEALVRTFGSRVRTFSLDLSDRTSWTQWEDVLKTEQPRITWLVNSAGFGKFGDYTAVDLSTSVNMIDLNCSAVVAMGMICLPYMPSGAHIVNLASQASFQPLPYLNVYAAGKAFVRHYSRALNRELKGKKITVTAVCPGWMDTPFFDRARSDAKQTVRVFWGMTTPKKVAQKAVRDAAGGKDMSVCSAYVKFCHTAAKLLPQRAMMKIWLMQQKIK